MKKGKGRAQYEEHGLPGDADDFDEGEVFADDLTTRRARSQGHTRQRLEMRDEEQWLRKQLADWDDEDFDWEDDEDTKRNTDSDDESDEDEDED